VNAAPPPALAAFRAAVGESYLRYAQARIGAERARPVLAAVWDELRARWSTVLAEDNFARCAWALLTSQLDLVGAPDDRAQDLQAVVGSEAADAVLLHYDLGLTLTAAASLIGATPSQVAVRVLMAERQLGPPRCHPTTAWTRAEPPKGA
jgi:hypothetical protein